MEADSLPGHDPHATATGDGRYDEVLLLVVGVAGVVQLVFFAATPALQPYYALLMPATIGLGGLGSWALLRAGRQRANVSADRIESDSVTGENDDDR